jgi:hypothetical protein
VYQTLLSSIASSDFPRDKLQILAIDDGSKETILVVLDAESKG